MPFSVAVVVATHNRAGLLPRLFAGLEAQTGVGDFEVAVVDDASTDDTWPVLKALTSRSPLAVRCERQAHNAGPATARNVGWRMTSAPVVAFTDDDCTPEPQWLAQLVAAAADNDVVQGRTLPDPAQHGNLGPFSRTLDISHEDGYYQTCNIAYRRELLEQLDGFAEAFAFPAGEDTDLAWRAKESGATTTFEPAAVVFHDIRRSEFRLAVADSWRWQSAALAVSRHPRLREAFATHYIWREAHRRALGVLAGAGLVAARPRSRLAWAGLIAGFASYADYRTRTAPLPGVGPRRRWLLLPGALGVDAAEIASCLYGSLKYRTLVL